MLYFTTLWLFCNYQFVLLNPFTFLFSWLKLLKWHTGSLCWEVKNPRWSQAHRIPRSPVGLQLSPSLPPRWHWKLFTRSENVSAKSYLIGHLVLFRQTRKLSPMKSSPIPWTQDLHLGLNSASESKEDRFYLRDALSGLWALAEQ